MDTDKFILLVQVALLDGDKKAATQEEVLRTIRALLKTLGEVMQPQQIQQLADALPNDIGIYLAPTTITEHESLNDFFRYVAMREGTTLPQAIHHSRTVVAVMQETVPDDVMQAMQEKLPHEFAPLFQ